MKICFLDNVEFPYTSENNNSKFIRGAENILINLSKEISMLGHQVTVYNNSIINSSINNVNWFNFNKINQDIVYDIALTNNDIRLFSKVKANKYVAFSHSIQSLEKFIRKKQLISYLKYRPKIVLLSDYHKINRNFLIKIFGTINLEWAVDLCFLQTGLDDKLIEDRAIFTSRADRNLNILIDIWKKYIFSKNKSTKLFVTPSDLVDNNYNIYSRKLDDRKILIQDMLKSKVLLIPGHKGELFCLAAEEARELCLPIVTLGIGSLSERVQHGITGFIAKNPQEFAYFTLKLLGDNSLWQSLRNNLISLRGSKKWCDVAANLLSNI